MYLTFRYRFRICVTTSLWKLYKSCCLWAFLAWISLSVSTSECFEFMGILVSF